MDFRECFGSSAFPRSSRTPNGNENVRRVSRRKFLRSSILYNEIQNLGFNKSKMSWNDRSSLRSTQVAKGLLLPLSLSIYRRFACTPSLTVYVSQLSVFISFHANEIMRDRRTNGGRKASELRKFQVEADYPEIIVSLPRRYFTWLKKRESRNVWRTIGTKRIEGGRMRPPGCKANSRDGRSCIRETDTWPNAIAFSVWKRRRNERQWRRETNEISSKNSKKVTADWEEVD